jgi:hypothetical protein
MSGIDGVQTLQGLEVGYRNSIGILKRTLDTKMARRAVSIVACLILALLVDLQRRIPSTDIFLQDLGWRNKYNIHMSTGLSQKVIYRECGIIDKLVDLGILEMRAAPSHWGQQKSHYRISGDFIQEWLIVEI